MKMKKARRLLSVLLTFSLVFSLSNFVASAGIDDPTVIYNVAAEQFSFENVGADDSNGHPDLFPHMKNLLPGDRITETINVRVTNMGSSTVNMYLRAEPSVDDPGDESAEDHNKAYQELMDYSKLTVFNKTTGEWITDTIGNDPNGVQLAEFSSSNAEQVLEVTLTISEWAGNELQDLLATIDWVFKVEVINHGGGGGSSYYDLTVNYYDQDGNEIHPSYQKLNIREGTSYDVTDKDAIEIEGYEYDRTEGDPVVGVMDSDKVIDVYYNQIEDIEEPETPEEEKPDGGSSSEEIPDPEVPGTDVPETGDSSAIWLMLALASGAGLLFLLLTSPKKKEESR